MTGIDTVATFLDQLDDMETILGLYDLRYLLSVLQVESDISVFGHHLAFTHKTGFTTFDGRTAVLGIQQGKCRKITFALIDTVGIFTQASFHILYFRDGHFRLLCDDLHLYLSRDIRDTVLRKILKVAAHFGRSHFDITYQLLLHSLYNQSVTGILAHGFADLRRSLVKLSFHPFSATQSLNIVIDLIIDTLYHF